MDEERKLKATPNTPEDLRLLQNAATSALKSGGDQIAAVAVVIARPNGDISASFAGMANQRHAFAQLLSLAPDVLKDVIDNAMKGKGITKVVNADTEEVVSRTQG